MGLYLRLIDSNSGLVIKIFGASPSSEAISAGATSGLAVPRTGASYRLDMTAIRLARQATSRPAAIISKAPVTPRACQPAAEHSTCVAVPATSGAVLVAVLWRPLARHC